MRKNMNQIALYSNGCFKVNDMLHMPLAYLDEIKETMVEKNEAENKNSKNRQTI